MTVVLIVAAGVGGIYVGVRFGDKVKAFIADVKAKFGKVGE